MCLLWFNVKFLQSLRTSDGLALELELIGYCQEDNVIKRDG
jgi:hypothetical protein